MSEVTVTVPSQVSEDDVAKACAEFVGMVGNEYGAARKYAAALVGFFRTTTVGDEWLTMAHDAKGTNGDMMRAKRDALYTALRSVTTGKVHSNPSVKWKQIKGYAQDLIAAETRAQRIADGESPEDIDAENEGEGNGKRETRSLQLRLVQDLSGLYRACKRDKARTDAQSAAMTNIASALNALGVDISKL